MKQRTVEVEPGAAVAMVITGTPPFERLATRIWGDFKRRAFTDQEWLCEPLFPKVSMGLVVSQAGHGKTTTMIELAVALATGLPFMGMPVSGPCGVGLLLLEDSENLIHGRLRAAVESYGDTFTARHERKLNANLRVIIERPLTIEELNLPAVLDLKLAGLVGELGEKMKGTEDPPGMLVIDTLNAVHEGDESSSTETRPLIAALRKLHLSLGASVYVTHHYRKMGVGNAAPALVDRMNPELIRGSSAIHAGARAVVQFATVSRADADKAEIKDWEDPQQYAVVGLTKNNGGRKSKWLLWKHTDHGLLVPVEEGERILAAMLGPKTPKRPMSQQDRLLMEIHTLDGKALDRDEMARTLGISPAVLRTALSRLVKARWITKKDALTVTGRMRAEALLGSSPLPRKY